MLHLSFVKNIPVSTGQKNCNTILQHHDNFCCQNPIASSMKKTCATPDLQSSLSPQHGLRPSCCLVCLDSLYFLRNRTISRMQNLLQDSYHHRKKGRWKFWECKSFFSAYQLIYSSASSTHRCLYFCFLSAAHQGVMVMFHNLEYQI